VAHHLPSVNVAKYQKGVYYLGIKVFNALPPNIKTEFNNNKKKLKGFYRNFYMKNPFIPWMKILTIRNARFTFGLTLPIGTITVGILPEEGFVIIIL
jgi:hypothetical protein